MGYVCVILRFSQFDTIPACDGRPYWRTDEQTDTGHTIYRASIASRGI